MTKEKTCRNCENYREGRGKYGLGICVSKKLMFDILKLDSNFIQGGML